MTAPPFAYFGGKTLLAKRIAGQTFTSGTGQGPDGWSNRTEVLWINREPIPNLFSKEARA